MGHFKRLACAVGVVVGLAAVTTGTAGAQITNKAGARCDRAGDVLGSLFCERKGSQLVWADNTLPRGVYRIGGEMVTSGAVASLGAPMAEGVRKAIEEMNKSQFLGPGTRIEYIERDSAGSAPLAIAAFNEFVAQKVSGVICCALTGIAGALAPLAVSKQTPMIVDASIVTGITQLPYVHRTVLLLGAPGGAQPQSAQLMAKSINAKSAAIAITADNQGMVEWADAYVAGLKAIGITDVLQVKTQAADTDLSGAASQIIAARHPMVVISMLGPPGSRLVKALKDRGYQGKIVASYGLGDPSNFAIAGPALEGVMFPTAFFADKPVNKRAREFVKWWKKNHGGQSPSVWPVQGYEAAYYLATGMKNSGDGSPQNVAKALARIGRMDTMYGQVRYVRGQMAYARTTSPLFLEWTATGTQKVWEPPKTKK